MTRSLRVLHVIPSIAARYGGPSQAVLGMCRALRAQGVDAQIATTDADGAHHAMPASDGVALVDGVPVWMFPRTFSESWKYSGALMRWLRAHVADFDVVHAHAVFSFSTTAAAVACAARGVPLIVRPCGMLAPYSLRQSARRKRAYWRLVEAANVSSAQALHATTPAERDELTTLVPRARAECIPLGVDEEAFTAPRTPGSFRARHGIDADRPLLLFLSRLHRKKGLVDALLPALRGLSKDTMLAVVGGADEHDPDHARAAQATVDSLGLRERVVFTGAINGAARWQAYDDADVYVLPSHHENFGATVVEAMARGAPVAVSEGVQVGPWVQEADAGRIAGPGASALARSLQDVLSMTSAARRDMGARGRRFTQQRLSWAACGHAARELYGTVAVGQR